MNPYSFSALVFAICSFLIGVQVLTRRKDNIGIYYFLLSLLYFIWGTGFAFLISNRFNETEALFWVRIANGAAIFIPIVWIYFCTYYIQEQPHPLLKILYIFPFIILMFVFTKHFLPSVKPILDFNYFPNPGPLCHLHLALYLTEVPVGFYLLIRRLKFLQGEEKRKLLSFFLIAFAGYLGGGLAFLPAYDIPFPQYGLFLLPLYPFGLVYFMSTQGLLNLENVAAIAHKDKLAALGILTASINHEIRAPLFVMRAMAETQEKDNQLRQNFLNQIDRITGIVSRLTHFAKKGVDEVAKIELVDLKEVLADIRPLFQHQLNYQQIEYLQEIPADLPKVLADRRYLEEILFNLILNACQALKNAPQPTIKLSACILEGYRQKTKDKSFGPQSSVVITIEDRGLGISHDQIKHIFKPFHTTKSEGTGLGLYITKQLVEKCGGKIEVLSQVGKGAQFLLHFRSGQNA